MSDLGTSNPEPSGNGRRGGKRPVVLIDVLEERVTGLVDRYRGAQKSAEELRSRLDAAESEIEALHARVEEAERLRAALRERVQLLIEQVRRLEQVAAARTEEAEA